MRYVYTVECCLLLLFCCWHFWKGGITYWITIRYKIALHSVLESKVPATKTSLIPSKWNYNTQTLWQITNICYLCTQKALQLHKNGCFVTDLLPTTRNARAFFLIFSHLFTPIQFKIYNFTTLYWAKELSSQYIQSHKLWFLQQNR